MEDPLQGESHALGAVVSLRRHFVDVPAEAVGEEQDLEKDEMNIILRKCECGTMLRMISIKKRE